MIESDIDLLKWMVGLISPLACAAPIQSPICQTDFRFFRDISPVDALGSTSSLWAVPCGILAALSMSSNITKRLFTFDDCLRMVETGILRPSERVELINGELIVMTPIGPRHGGVVDRTNRAFIKLADDKAIVRTQGTVVLDRFVAPEPDIVLLRPRADDYVTRNPGVDDILLIIEVADSSLEYDTTAKLSLYAILGIPEYWVADLQNQRLLVHSDAKGDAYASVRELRVGESLAPRLLPECRITTDLLFA
jgi:Uma2 family endonuclease